MSYFDDEDYAFEDECQWHRYLVTASNDETGEMREQMWWARNANHALERASRDDVVLKGMTEAKASWKP